MHVKLRSVDKRVGIYLRVSTTGQSTDLQRDEILSFLKARGLTSLFVYEDTQTGTTAMRPALRTLMKDVRARKLDIVVCWKMDRLFRSLKDLLTTLNEFSDLKIEFVSLKDNIDMTTASGRLLTHLLGAFSEFEANLIKERVHAGLENAKRKGIKLGRPKSIILDKVIKLREEGLSLSGIAKILGVSKSGVSKVLKQSRIKLGLKKPLPNPASQVLEITQTEIADSAVENTNVLSTPAPKKNGVNHD